MTGLAATAARSVMIVGATGGIGRALAQEYAKRQWNVALWGRNPAELEDTSKALHGDYPAQKFPFAASDVRDSASLSTVFHSLAGELGSLDLMIYAAGVMTDPYVHSDVDFAAEADMFAVNTVAAVHVLGLSAEYMRAKRSGHLAAIGSVAGERGRKGNPAYGASKAALHTYMEGLRNRLHPLNIRVSTIKPGFVRTRMLGGKRYPGAIAPADAAKRIANALDRGAQSFFVPFWWGAVALAVRTCPSFIFKRFGPA